MPGRKGCLRAKLLMEVSADVDSGNDNRWMPLHKACKRGYDARARLLVEAGAVSSKVDGKGSTPLCMACITGRDTCTAAAGS